MNPSSRIKISALDPAVNAAIETIGGLLSFLKGDSRAADKPGKRMGQIHLLTQYCMPRVGQFEAYGGTVAWASHPRCALGGISP